MSIPDTSPEAVERFCAMLLDSSHGVYKDGRTFDLAHTSDMLRALRDELTATQAKLASARNDALEEVVSIVRQSQPVHRRWISRAVLLHELDTIKSPTPKEPTDTRELDLKSAIAKAQAAYKAMTPEQKAAHDKAQRESFVRGMMPTGDPSFD